MTWTNLDNKFLYGTELNSEDLRNLRDNIEAFANGDDGSPIMRHATLSGLSQDDHTQYHTDSRGDARYYTQTQLNSGQMDDRYYTESEVDSISGSINTKLDTHKSSSDHDSRYYTQSQVYTQTQLNAGQLDGRYYTKSEVTTISGNIVTQIVVDHGSLTGLTDDDHTQYLNTTRGDARYYTQTQLNAGQMDSRYYTEAEISTISGNIVSQIPTSYYHSGGTDVTVADGGTGRSSHTAYMPIAGGTSTTGAQQSIATGTQYYPLCYNTSSSLPTFQVCAVAGGGTGATTAATARTNLGLDTMAVQDASAVAITGGTINGITDLAVADGGTGASTAATARTNLGLGTMSIQSAAAVAITGGTISAGLTADDHGTSTTPEVVNVVYGTGSAPTASTTTIGSLFIQYTA